MRQREWAAMSVTVPIKQIPVPSNITAQQLPSLSRRRTVEAATRLKSISKRAVTTQRQGRASLDNFLGEVVGGAPAVAVGCFQCHGSTVKVLPGGEFDPSTWPNTGIGRINPDGSGGSCSPCHTRHLFSKAQAREPAACGKCHLGPDHP